MFSPLESVSSAGLVSNSDVPAAPGHPPVPRGDVCSPCFWGRWSGGFAGAQGRRAQHGEWGKSTAGSSEAVLGVWALKASCGSSQLPLPTPQVLEARRCCTGSLLAHFL